MTVFCEGFCLSNIFWDSFFNFTGLGRPKIVRRSRFLTKKKSSNASLLGKMNYVFAEVVIAF